MTPRSEQGPLRHLVRQHCDGEPVAFVSTAGTILIPITNRWNSGACPLVYPDESHLDIDAAFGERHDATASDAKDPDEAVLGVRSTGDLPQPVVAKTPCSATDRGDGNELC